LARSRTIFVAQPVIKKSVTNAQCTNLLGECKCDKPEKHKLENTTSQKALADHFVSEMQR
jgi:hypothetical protein